MGLQITSILLISQITRTFVFAYEQTGISHYLRFKESMMN